jgi:hypothetical protein
MGNAKVKLALAWRPRYDLEKLIESAWTYARAQTRTLLKSSNLFAMIEVRLADGFLASQPLSHFTSLISLRRHFFVKNGSSGL